MEVDLKTSMWLSGPVIRYILQSANTNGVIIDIYSTPAVERHIEGVLCAIAKAANIAMTKCIAIECSSNHIRVFILLLVPLQH
jgi:NAD(P)-dependent dehydrogenase (short-subunit alcohol dehydrogenase family)